MKHFVNNLIHDATVKSRLAGSEKTMRQRRFRQAFDVVRKHILPAMNGGVRLAGPVKRQGAARAHAKLNPIMRSRGAYNLDNITFNGRLYMDFADHLLQGEELFCSQHRLQFCQGLFLFKAL